MVANWLENGLEAGEIVAGYGDVADSDRNHDGVRWWSKKFNLNEGKPSRVMVSCVWLATARKTAKGE